MYAWIWKHLPGSITLRTLIATGCVIVLLAVLFFVAFPAIETVLPYANVDVGPE